MKAEDTVMSFMRIEEIDAKNATSNFTDALFDVAREQAQISFRAGIREVIEWGRETCPHYIGMTYCYKRVCDTCWQSKLKEWGVIDENRSY